MTGSGEDDPDTGDGSEDPGDPGIERTADPPPDPEPGDVKPTDHGRDDTRRGTPDDHTEAHRDERPTLAGSTGEKSGTSRDMPQGTVTREQPEDGNEDSWVTVVRDVAVTVIAVLLVGGYLFAISGVWPPMVAIESGSMEPNMEVNDMVFVMDEQRFQPAAAEGETGVVTAQRGAETGYGQFGNPGDVIIFEPGGNGARTPIIHRAMFWVEAGENWCEQADPDDLGRVDPGDEVCEADHAGFITKGDANSNYDQAGFGRSGGPVKPEWIIGTAEVRLPGLGWFRLQF